MNTGLRVDLRLSSLTRNVARGTVNIPKTLGDIIKFINKVRLAFS